MDQPKFQQRYAIKFCVKLGESVIVTYEKLQRAYGEHSLSDEPHTGRPSTSKMEDNVERVRSLVRSDRRLTLRMISSELNLNSPSNFNTGFGHEKSVCQYGSKEPHN